MDRKITHFRQKSSFFFLFLLFFSFFFFFGARAWRTVCRQFSNSKWTAKSRIFVKNRRFSNSKRTAKSRIFVKNRWFSNRKWAVKSRIFEAETRFKIDQRPFSALVSENGKFWYQLFAQNVSELLSLFRTPRTHGRRTITIFSTHGLKTSAECAGQKLFGTKGLSWIEYFHVFSQVGVLSLAVRMQVYAMQVLRMQVYAMR